MAHTRMVEIYVEHLISELVGDAEGTADGAFILPFPGRPVVDVVPGPAATTLRVRVRAAVVHDAEPTGEVLAALNDANGWLPYGRLYLDGGTVIVEETIAGAWIEFEPLRNAARFVDWVACDLGAELAASAGGRPAVAHDTDDRGAPGQDPGNTQLALAVTGGPMAAADGVDTAEPGRAAPVNVAGYL